MDYPPLPQLVDVSFHRFDNPASQPSMSELGPTKPFAPGCNRHANSKLVEEFGWNF